MSVPGRPQSGSCQALRVGACGKTPGNETASSRPSPATSWPSARRGTGRADRAPALDESIEEGLIRDVAEETGLRVEPVALTGVYNT